MRTVIRLTLLTASVDWPRRDTGLRGEALQGPGEVLLSLLCLESLVLYQRVLAPEAIHPARTSKWSLHCVGSLVPCTMDTLPEILTAVRAGEWSVLCILQYSTLYSSLPALKPLAHHLLSKCPLGQHWGWGKAGRRQHRAGYSGSTPTTDSLCKRHSELPCYRTKHYHRWSSHLCHVFCDRFCSHLHLWHCKVIPVALHSHSGFTIQHKRRV